MKKRIAEVSYNIEEIEVIADNNVQARDLVVKYLRETKSPKWKSIRVRDTSGNVLGPARVLPKR
jgi:hypothetical protein